MQANSIGPKWVQANSSQMQANSSQSRCQKIQSRSQKIQFRSKSKWIKPVKFKLIQPKPNKFKLIKLNLILISPIKCKSTSNRIQIDQIQIFCNQNLFSSSKNEILIVYCLFCRASRDICC